MSQNLGCSKWLHHTLYFLITGFLLQVDHLGQIDADNEMQQLLNGTYENVKELLQRNKAALDQIVNQLATTPPNPDGSPETQFSGNSLTGIELNEIVVAFADKTDLARRDIEKAAFM